MITEQRVSRPAAVLAAVVGCALLFLGGGASAQDGSADAPPSDANKVKTLASPADANNVTTPAPPAAEPSLAEQLRLTLQSAQPVIEPKPSVQLVADKAVAVENQAERPSTEPKITIFGAAKLDFIYSEKRPQGAGVPFFLVPEFTGGFTNHTFDANARQSLLGVLFKGPVLGNYRTGGRVSAVFFDPAVVVDRNGFLLQASYGEVFNDRWRFATGLQFDVFAPGLPTVLPFSYLGGSGSPGNCIRGQIRAEHFVPVGSDSQLTLQGAISEALQTAVYPDITLDEDNGKPNLEARISYGGGKPAPIGLLTQRPLEVGISGVAGELRRTAAPFEPPRRVVSDVWGAAVDFRVNLAGRYGFKGEAYTGQALGNYNGAILQSLDAVTWEAIRTKGGFVEGFVYLKPNVHMHIGYGIDDPDDDDITAVPNTISGRTYNSTFYSNVLWEVDKAFRIGLELTYRKTEYKEPTNHTNEGFGLHTQFAWTF